MKKILTLFLAAVMLFSCLPAAFAEETKREVTLDASSNLTINRETGYVENMPGPMSVSELLINFKDKADLTVTDAKGNALTMTDTVGSDAVISVGEDSVKTLVLGDVDRDGKINVKDAIAIVKSVAGLETDMNATAGDVTFDGKANVKDVMSILKLVAGWDVCLTSPDALGIETADKDDKDIEIYFEDAMNRIGASNTNFDIDAHTYTAKMAKNEIETVQIFLTSTAQKTGMSLEIGDMTNENGAVLEMERRYQYYYQFAIFNQLKGRDFSNYTDDRFSDPLPNLVNPFDLTANESKGFVVKVKATAESEAGLYKAPVELKDADGNVVKRATLRAYVWDFTLDETPASTTAFGFSVGTPAGHDGPLAATEDVAIPRYIKYYDYFLENKVSAYNMPYKVTDPRADQYMSDPRVTSFCVAGGGQYNGISNVPDAEIQAVYAKLRQDPEWLDKAYIYLVDEPCNDGLLLVQQQWEWASRVIPEMDFQIVVPLAGNAFYSKWDADAAAFIEPYINIWCPQSYAFTRYYTNAELKEGDRKEMRPEGTASWTSHQSYNKYGQWAERWENYREDGNKMWWYVCISPMLPHANFFQYYQGVNVRMVLWQQYMFDVDGLLYYAMAYGWGSGVSKRKTTDGDGLLVYPGSLFGEEPGPVPCIRFEEVRDGIEDFQYLTQLEELTDRDTSMEYVNRLTTAILHFSEDHHKMAAVRDEVGFYLESLYSAQ